MYSSTDYSNPETKAPKLPDQRKEVGFKEILSNIKKTDIDLIPPAIVGCLASLASTLSKN